MDLLCFCSVLCLLCLWARLFICALWSPAGKGHTSWHSFVVSTVSLSLSHWYPGSGVALDLSIPDLCTLTHLLLIQYLSCLTIGGVPVFQGWVQLLIYKETFTHPFFQ